MAPVLLGSSTGSGGSLTAIGRALAPPQPPDITVIANAADMASVARVEANRFGITFIGADGNQYVAVGKVASADGGCDSPPTELYQLTKNPHDHAVAKSACHFMNKHLLRKSGLYAHRLEQDGTLRPGDTSVEQGSAIGALVSMYEATHDRDYLNQAKTTAQAAMKSFTLDKLKTQPESFNAIYFRGLEKLRQYDPHNPEYKKSIGQYLRYAQNHGRVLVDQAGVGQLLALEKLTPRGAGRVS